MAKKNALQTRTTTAPAVAEETKVVFASGAQRGERLQYRYDLIPTHAIRRLGMRYLLGTKYGEWNWAKGMPFSDVLNHGIDHLMKYRDRYVALKEASPGASEEEICALLVETTTDDDLAGAAWACFTLMELEQRGKFTV